MAEATEEITLPCPDCDFVATGNPKGRNSAPFKIGAHRARAHGYKAAKPSPKRAQPSNRKQNSQPVLSLFDDVAADITGDGPPTEAQLTKALARGLGTVSVAAASWFAETDMTVTTEDEREEIVDLLCLEKDEATEIMAPIASAIAPTKLNKRYGRAVVKNIDTVGSVAAIASFGLRYARYFRERNRRYDQLASAGIIPARSKVARRGPAPAQPAGPLATEPIVQSPPPQEGVIWTADMVAAATNGHQ